MAHALRVPPPRLYVYFDAIVRHGSIRSAADSLSIASSALNRRLLDLEEQIGAVLFDRMQTGVRLTPAGKILHGHVQRTLHDAAAASGQLLELHGLVSGHVSIGSAESAAIELLPGLVAAFQGQRPGVHFALSVGSPAELVSDLLADRVDMILTHETPGHAMIATLASSRRPFCAVMREGHPLAARDGLLLHHCQEYPVVLAQQPMAARGIVEAMLATLPLRLQPVLVTNNFEVMKQYVRLTDAVSLQFNFKPAMHGPDGLVAIPLADQQLATSSLSLAVRRDRVLPAAAAAMVDVLQGVMGG